MVLQEVGKTIFISILAKLARIKRILIIDFDFLNNNLHSVFGVNKYQKGMKEKLKSEEYIKEFRLNEKNVEKLIVKVDRKIDLVTNAKIIFDETYKCNKEKIERMLEELKTKYDLILIDVSGDSMYREFRKVLLELSNKTVCLVEGNLVQLRKTINILKEHESEKDKIKLVYNKRNKYGVKKNVLKVIFFKYKILGSLSYDNSYNKIINKNVNKLYINKKIRKEFDKIINKLQII